VEGPVERQLAAILAADVVGYSAMIVFDRSDAPHPWRKVATARGNAAGRFSHTQLLAFAKKSSFGGFVALSPSIARVPSFFTESGEAWFSYINQRATDKSAKVMSVGLAISIISCSRRPRS
jgi:hypothetical protein